MEQQALEEILKRLDLLAVKLGTTGTHLWEVMTKQGIVASFEGLLVIIISSICIYLLIKKADWIAKKDLGVFGVIAVFVFFILFIDGFSQIFYIFNSEYYALEQFLNLCK